MSDPRSVDPTADSGTGIRGASPQSGAERTNVKNERFRYLKRAAPFIAAAFLSLTFAPFPRPPVDLGSDADTSLAAVLGFARAHNLQYGHDIVMTYGVFGDLVFFFSSPGSAGLRMCADVILAYIVALGLFLVVWRLPLIWRCLLLTVFCFGVPNVPLLIETAIDCGLLFWGLLAFIEAGRRLVGVAVVLVALTVYAGLSKVSYLFGPVLGLVLLAGDLALRERFKLSIGLLVSYVAVILGTWVAAGQQLANFIELVKNSFLLVQAYNKALSWEGLTVVKVSGFTLLALAAGAIATRIPFAYGPDAKRRGLRRFVLFTWTGLLVFMVWKHGYVREDFGHSPCFLAFVPVLGFALEVVPCDNRVWLRVARAFALAGAVVGLAVAQYLYFPEPAQALGKPLKWFAVNARKLADPAEYFRWNQAAWETNRQVAALPKMREIVGRADVGCFGHLPVYVILNDLDYKPAPVFLSYVAADGPLMRLNERFYLSTPPRFVLFSLGGVDRKFSPLEDALVLRYLLCNYELAGAEAQFLLLKEKTREPAKLTLLREGDVGLSQRIELSPWSQSNLWLEVDLRPSLFGRVRELLYRAPTVRLAAWRGPDGGLLTRRRSPAAAMSAGFVASPLLLETADVEKLYAGESKHPGAYSVEITPGDERFWQKSIHYRVYRIENLIPK